MGQKTNIQYCDSTLNLQMGCSGCELWEKKGKVNPRRTCYAGRLTEEVGGSHKGFPSAFDQPLMYPERMEQGLKWKDLTYTTREGKFWLDKFPRVIFLNDMGDTFTEPLPLDWIAPFIPKMEHSPNIYLMLTKRVDRMSQFWKAYGKVPDNIWLGASVTSNANLKSRIRSLVEIEARTLWLSVEPMLEKMYLHEYLPYLQWIVAGFESGPGCRKGKNEWLNILRDECSEYETAYFVKQLGGERDHRGNLSDIPQELHIRTLPDWTSLDWIGRSQPKPLIPTQLGLI